MSRLLSRPQDAFLVTPLAGSLGIVDGRNSGLRICGIADPLARFHETTRRSFRPSLPARINIAGGREGAHRQMQPLLDRQPAILLAQVNVGSWQSAGKPFSFPRLPRTCILQRRV